MIACRTGEAPPGLAERYAQALKEDRLRDAWALTSESFQSEVGYEAFAKRYASKPERERRADEILADRSWRTEQSGLLAVAHNDQWRLIEPELLAASVRAPLERFVAAVEARDFKAAWGLLSERWRAAYTAESFARDFDADPKAKERLARAKLALTQPVKFVDDGAIFPIGEGRSVVMVREAGEYRVAAIE